MTTLSGNAVDGLNVNGNGIYAFETLNAQDNGDDGIDVTSQTGQFTTTGGTISGNRDQAVKIDPILVGVVLDSITHSGGSTAVLLDNVSGSFTVTGATTISGTAGDAISISNSSATVSFNGGTAITDAGGAGIILSGNSGAIVFGDGTTIASPGGDGVTLAGNSGEIRFAGGATITGAGSDGLTLSGNSGPITFVGATSAIDSARFGIELSGNTGAVVFDGDTTIANSGGDGIALTNNSGASTFGGTTTITNPSSGMAAVDIEGSNGAIAFSSLQIALLSANSTGLDLSNALVNSDVTANDFDLTSTTASGTVGVNLAAAAGTGTVRLGDTSVGGASASIGGAGGNASGPATGVLVSAATGLNFIFGDGEGITDVGSSITALTPIAATDTLPFGGTYNFLDANLVGDVSGLATDVTVYYVDNVIDGVDDGTREHPGTILGAMNSTADAIVLVDRTGGDVIDTNAASQGAQASLLLDDNQQLYSFLGGDSINVGGGAPANFLLTGIDSGTVTNPFTGTGSPTLTTTAAADTVTLADANLIEGVQISNGAAASSIAGTGSSATVRDSATGLLTFTGMTGTVTITNTSLSGLAVNGGSVAVVGTNADITNGANMATVSATGGHSGSISFDAASTISASNGSGLQFDNADGIYTLNGTTTLNGGDAAIDIVNGSGGSFTFGTGTTITNPTGTAFNLADSTASVSYSGGMTQTNAAALVSVTNHSGGTVAFQAGTLSATNGTGLQFDNAGGIYTFNGTTTLNGGDAAIDIVNGSAGTFTFGAGASITSPSGIAFNVNGNSADVTYNGTITQNVAVTAVWVINNTGGTITIGGMVTANTSTAPAIVFGTNAGTTISFNGGLDIDTTTGTGLSAFNGGTVNIAATAADESINVTNGSAIRLDNVAVGISLDTVSANGASRGIFLNGVSGVFTVTGATTVSNSSIAGIDIEGTTAAVSFNGGTTITNLLAYGILLVGNTGPVSFLGTTTIGSPATNGEAVHVQDTSGAINFDQLVVSLSNANSTGFYAANAILAGDITITDFDLTSSSAVGTTGIDISGVTSPVTNSTIFIGDPSTPENLGQSATISGVDTGVLVSPTTNIGFTFGDGEAVQDVGSTIDATTPIRSTGALPTLGTYNFLDVTLTGDTSNLVTTVTVYYVDDITDGIDDGTRDHPGTIFGASITTATAIVLVNNALDVDNTIDAGSATQGGVGSLTLDPNQRLYSFNENGTTVNVGGGAPGNFLLTGISSGEITNPAPGLGAPTLTTSTLGSATIRLGSNSTIEGVVVTNGAATYAVNGSFIDGSFISDSSLTGLRLSSSTGLVTITDTTMTKFAIDGGNINVNGANADISTSANDIAFRATSGHTGTISFNAASSVTATNGTGFEFDDADGTYRFLGVNTLNGGDAGIDIVNGSAGTFVFSTAGSTTTTITNPTGIAFNIDDSTASVTYNGSITQTANNQALVSVTNHSVGTVTFQNGTLNATTGTGLQFSNADGTYNFNGTTTLNGGDAGIDILAGSTGTFTFGTGAAIVDPTGIAFNVDGSAASVTYNGTITQNNAVSAVSLTGNTGGSVTFGGTITANTTTATAISAANNTGGTFTFAGQVTANTTSGTGVLLDTNTGATFNFDGGLDITTTGGDAFLAVFGGTVTVTGADNTIASGGNGLMIGFTDVGLAGVRFDDIVATSNASGAGVLLIGVDLQGDVDIRGLKDTGYIGGSFGGLTGAGQVDLTGTIDIDVSNTGFDFSTPAIGTVNIANTSTSILTIDGGLEGISFRAGSGTVNIGGNGASAKIGDMASTTDWAILKSAGGGATTLNYTGSIEVDQGIAVWAAADNNGVFGLAGTVTSTGSAAAFNFQAADGTYTIASTIAHTGTGVGVAVTGTSGTITFSGTSKSFDTSGGVNTAVSMAGTGSLSFTNGGLDITTGTGTGLSATAGTINVTGGVNDDEINSTAGTAVSLSGVTAGITLDTITAAGGTNGISLSNMSGSFSVSGATTISNTTGDGIALTGNTGTVSFLGTTSITNPAATFAAVDVEGANGAISFADLDIALLAANTTGFDLSGAVLNGNVTATDFDLTSNSAAGTVGVNLVGATGAGIVQLGDSSTPFAAGQDATIAGTAGNPGGPATGVLVSSSTNLTFIFGDGEETQDTDSSITAVKPVDDDGTGFPDHGTDDYNFLDVDLIGDIIELQGPTVFVVDNLGTAGAGTFADPGTIAQAEGAAVDVIVLIDSTSFGVSNDIDLGSGSLDLDDGQVLISLVANQGIDVAPLGAAGTGAPPSFHFTGFSSSSTITAPGTVDSVLPTLTASGAGATVSLVGAAGIQNVHVENTAAGAGIAGAIAGDVIIRGTSAADKMIVEGGDGGAIVLTDGATPSTLALSNLTLSSTGGDVLNIDGSVGAGVLTVSSFADITLDGGNGETGGAAFSTVTFDATPGGTIQQVDGNAFVAGTTSARIGGFGLALDAVQGDLKFDTTSIAVTTVISPTFGGIAVAFGIFAQPTSGTGTTLDFGTATLNVVGTGANPLLTPAAFYAVPGTGNEVGFSGVATVTTTNAAGLLSETVGTVFFGDGTTVNATGAPAIQFANGVRVEDGTGGAAEFGAITANGGQYGIYLSNIDGIGMTFAGPVNISNTTVNAIQLVGSESVTFSGAVNITSATQGGVSWQPTAAGDTLSFTGTSTLAITNSGGVGLSSTAGIVDIDGVLTINTTNGTGLQATGGTVNIAATAGAQTITATTGAAIVLQNATAAIALDSVTASGGLAGISVINVDNSSIVVSGNVTVNDATNGGAGIFVQNSDNTTFTVSGLTTVVNDVGAGVVAHGVDLQTNAGSTFNFNGGVDITVNGTNAFGFRAQSSGTVNILDPNGTNQITSQNGTALLINPTTVNINLTNLTAGGGSDGVSLTGMSGSLTVTGTVTVTNVGDDGLFITGLLGTVDFNSIAINGTGGDGIEIDNTTATGAITISGGNVGGTNDPTGRGVFIDNGTGNITIDADITKTSDGKVVEVTDRTGGTISFGGDVGAITGTDSGISFSNNTGGSTVFGAGGIVGVLVTGTNNALTVVGSSGHTVSFASATTTLISNGSGNVVDIANGATLAFNGATINANGTGTALQADGGGTIVVTGTGNLDAGTNATAVNLNGVAIGAGGVTFNSTDKNAGGVSAVIMSSVTGTGAVNLGTGTLNGGTGAVIRIGDGAGGASTGGTAGLVYAGAIVSGTGRAIDIQDRVAGAQAITLSGGISHSVAGQTGIFLDDNAGGTIRFDGDITITSTTANAISLTDNTGATIIFSPEDMNVTTTSGTAFLATGGGTITLRPDNVDGGGGAAILTSGTGTGVDLQGVIIGSGNFTPDVVNVNGAAVGIRLTNVTGGTFSIGGGIIQNTTSAAIDINGGSSNIFVANTTISNSAGRSVQVVNRGTGTITLLATSITDTGQGMLFQDNTGGSTSFLGSGSRTIDADGADNALTVINSASHSVSFSGTTTIQTTGSGNAIDISNGATLAFTGTTINATGTGAALQADGGGTVTITGSGNLTASATATAVNLSGVAVGGVTVASTNKTAGATTNAVTMTNVTGGTVNLGTGTLGATTGAVVSISGGTAGFTYSGNVNQTNNAALLSVSGGHATGTVTFQTGTLNATNGTGLQFSNADGTYNFNGTTTLNGGDAGIDILTGSQGTFSFGSGTTITNPTGIGFNVDGDGALTMATSPTTAPFPRTTPAPSSTSRSAAAAPSPSTAICRPRAWRAASSSPTTRAARSISRARPRR